MFPIHVSFKRVFARYHLINGPILAKGLAFATLFALVPLLFLLSIAGSYALTPALIELLEREILNVLPPATRVSLVTGLSRFAENPGSLSIITIPLFLWTVHALFFDIHRIVRAAFNLPVSAGTGRLRALAMNGTFLLLIYVSALLSLGVQFAAPWLPGPTGLIRAIAALSAMLILAAVIWSMIRLSAGVSLAKRSSFPVAVLAAVIWQIASLVFGQLVRGTGRRLVLYGVLATAISILALTRIYAEILLQTALWMAELDPRYPQETGTGAATEAEDQPALTKESPESDGPG